jgi:hypothetical protein
MVTCCSCKHYFNVEMGFICQKITVSGKDQRKDIVSVCPWQWMQTECYVKIVTIRMNRRRDWR